MLKIQIMDMLLPWLLKTGGKPLVTVLIAVIGYKVIRAIRKGVGRSMEKAGLEVTLRKFLDALLYAVLIGLLVFMVAEELGIKSSSLVTIAGAVTLAMSLSHLTKITIQWIYLTSDLIVLGLSLTYIPVRRIGYSLLTVILSGQLIGLMQRIRLRPEPKRAA